MARFVKMPVIGTPPGHESALGAAGYAAMAVPVPTSFCQITPSWLTIYWRTPSVLYAAGTEVKENCDVCMLVTVVSRPVDAVGAFQHARTMFPISSTTSRSGVAWITFASEGWQAVAHLEIDALSAIRFRAQKNLSPKLSPNR